MSRKEALYQNLENEMKEMSTTQQMLKIFEWVFIFLTIGAIGTLFYNWAMYFVYGGIYLMTIYLIVINNKVKKKMLEKNREVESK
jgi:hypothetical protein